MFPQQRAIYSRLVPEVSGKTVLEAGCGVGLGTAILSRTWNDLLQNLGLRDESHA
jgi:protein-L-isoaspartate O-methyltransferase